MKRLLESEAPQALVGSGTVGTDPRLRSKYDYWCFEGCTYSPERLRNAIERLRTYIRRPNIGSARRYLAAARLEAYKWAYQARTGKKPTREDRLHDIPPWAIPGLGTHLAEQRGAPFWATWTAVVDGVLYQCDAILVSEANRQYWWAWRGPAGKPKYYLGTFASFKAARTASLTDDTTPATA
jgi:hypothetical protein